MRPGRYLSINSGGTYPAAPRDGRDLIGKLVLGKYDTNIENDVCYDMQEIAFRYYFFIDS